MGDDTAQPFATKQIIMNLIPFSYCTKLGSAIAKKRNLSLYWKVRNTLGIFWLSLISWMEPFNVLVIELAMAIRYWVQPLNIFLMNPLKKFTATTEFGGSKLGMYDVCIYEIYFELCF